jgi:hypothetical protein
VAIIAKSAMTQVRASVIGMRWGDRRSWYERFAIARIRGGDTKAGKTVMRFGLTKT